MEGEESEDESEESSQAQGKEKGDEEIKHGDKLLGKRKKRSYPESYRAKTRQLNETEMELTIQISGLKSQIRSLKKKRDKVVGKILALQEDMEGRSQKKDSESEA